MNGGGIKDRKRASLNGYQQTDLRAAEDHPFSPLLREFFDDADVEGAEVLLKVPRQSSSKII